MAHVEHLHDARDAVCRASESADGETREQLNSVEEALTDTIDLAADDGEEQGSSGGRRSQTSGGGEEPHLDRLAELERKLSGLTAEEEENPDAQQDVEDALEALDDYRREADPEE